jgi:methyl-accepting chemotaxis protein
MPASNSFFSRLTRPRRIEDLLLVGLGTVGLVVVVAGLLQLAATQVLLGRVDTQLGADAPAHELLLNIDRDSYQAQLAVERLLLEAPGADLSGLVDEYTSNRDQTLDRWEAYTAVSRGIGDEQDRWPGFLEARDRWVTATGDIVNAAQEGRRADDATLVGLVAASRTGHDDLRAVLDGIVEEIYVPSTNSLGSRLSLGTWISRAILVATVLVGAVLAQQVARRLGGRLATALAEVRDRAGQLAAGQTDITLPEQGLEELDELAGAFTSIAASQGEAAAYAQRLAGGDLRERYTPRSDRDDLGQALALLHGGLTDIVGGARTAAGEVTRQVGELQEVTADSQTDPAEDPAETPAPQPARVGENGSAAMLSMALQSAVRVVDEAEAGVRALNDTTTAMSGVSDSIGDTETIVGELVQHSTDVSEAVSFIRGVADQTNLLALNASIEAARAGEAGRGFAVVANEVKGLAEEAARSTDRVAQVVQAMTQSVEMLTASMAQGRDRVNDGATVIESATRSFHSINRGVDEVRSRIEEATISGREIADALTGAERQLDQAIGRFELATR